MPWLEKDKVLFIHVPRCGGTSITKHHHVGEKAQQGKNLYHRIGLKYYYYRYRLLENANFPFLTIENAIALFEFSLAFFLFFFFPGLPVPYVMWCTSSLLFINSTFIWTAPILMRTDILRIALMYFQDQVMCRFGTDEIYLVGTNRKGYLFHLTAERCIRYGYVSLEEMKRTSFSIVRNPYSRAVSMYHYNQRMFESFEHFMRDFHAKCMKTYHKEGKTDSIDIYCHVLPMYAYTHIDGKQVVNTIIKQEHLTRLVATEWKDSGVPKAIQDALTGIPHANSRKKKMPWQQYFNQETMDLALEMYEKDFDIFGYDKTIPGRPELIPKIQFLVKEDMPSSRQTLVGTMLRQSISVSDSHISEHIPSFTSESTTTTASTDDFGSRAKAKEYDGTNAPQSPTNKNRRTVSISDRVETKFIEGMGKATTPTAGSKMVDYDVRVNRRGTSAGENTSEYPAYRNSESYPEVLKPRDSVTSVDSKTGFPKQASWESDIIRKKRSASAFVLHLG